MKYFSSLLTAALIVATVSAQVTVNTPANVVECGELVISWFGGTPPYSVSVHSGTDVNGDPLISFPSTNNIFLTWPAVNITAGNSLIIDVLDSAGNSSQSGVFTIQNGGDNSCLGAPDSSTAGSSSTTPATKASGSSSSSSSKPSTGSSSNAAMATGVTYGVAGVLGAAVAAIFV